MSLPTMKQIDYKVGEPKRVNSAITMLTGVSAYTTTSVFGGSPGGGNDTTVGVITTSPSNRVRLFARLTGREITDAAGNTIFGRTTFTTGPDTFTTTLFVSDGAGGESAYSPVAGQNNTVLDMQYIEVVQAKDQLPTRAVNFLFDVNEIGTDPNSHQFQPDTFLTPTNGQTTFTLSQTPKAGTVRMYINGIAQIPTVDFSVSGTTVTFNAVVHSISTTDRIWFGYDR